MLIIVIMRRFGFLGGTMANLTINIPDEYLAELSNIAKQLKKSPEQCMLLALNYFMQTNAVESAVEGIARMEDGEALVDFPELKEELGIEMKFHPLAMDELEEVVEEDQIEVLEQLINRISAHEEEEEDALDLVLNEEGNNQLILSTFSFGDVVYQVGQSITIFHIALTEDEDDDEEEEVDDEHELDAEFEEIVEMSEVDEAYKLSKSDN
jgi:predicted transcriptional regulator